MHYIPGTFQDNKIDFTSCSFLYHSRITASELSYKSVGKCCLHTWCLNVFWMRMTSVIQEINLCIPFSTYFKHVPKKIVSDTLWLLRVTEEMKIWILFLGLVSLDILNAINEPLKIKPKHRWVDAKCMVKWRGQMRCLKMQRFQNLSEIALLVIRKTDFQSLHDMTLGFGMVYMFCTTVTLRDWLLGSYGFPECTWLALKKDLLAARNHLGLK